jgi:hypothetical protein
MEQWIVANEAVISGAFYWFLAGFVLGMLFGFSQARSVVRKHLKIK